MATNSRRQRVVLFGGLPLFAPADPALHERVLGDTWEHFDPTIIGGGLLSLVLTPSSAPVGGDVTATVTLSQTAPAGGTQVVVAARGQRISAQLPATVLVPESSTSAQVQFHLISIATPGEHSIDATLGGDTKTATLTITA